MSEKAAYTPAEFASIFSREKTWTYRQLYDGKIDAITTYGRTMIPASQIARIANSAARYCKKGRQRGETSAGGSEVKVVKNANYRWLVWLAQRKAERAKVKGMSVNRR